MAVQVQRRGGTTVQHDAFVGANREITVDTTKKTLVVHDGVTQGGNPLAREDLSNVDISGLPLAKQDMSNVTGDDIAILGIAKKDMTNVSLADLIALGLAKDDLSNVNAPATETESGLIQLADDMAALLGIDTQKAMTPALVRSAILNANIGMPRGYIDGLTLSVNADPRKLNIMEGACKTSDHAGSVLYPAATNIDINVSGDNGILSGTLSPHTWYNVLVGNKAGIPVAGFSIPNQKPGGWDNFRRIGSVKTDVNSDIMPFIQIGDYFFWKETSVEVESVWVGSAFQALIINVPEGVKNLALLTGGAAHTNATGNSIGLAVRTPGTTNNIRLAYEFMSGNYDSSGGGIGIVPTNQNSQIEYGAIGTASQSRVSIHCLGYIDSRG